MELSKFTCPHCEASLKLPSGTKEGKKIRCPKCQETFALPTAATSKKPLPPPDEVEVEEEEMEEAPARSTPTAGLLACNELLVKSKTKGFSSKKAFEIVDAADGEKLGRAEDTAGFFAALLGAVNLEVRDEESNKVVFVVRRSGWLFKKDHVLDAKDRVVGRYKSKLFSLSGGFHVYDKDGKHIVEIKGNMFKAEYKFLTPDKKEMGKVSRTWGGLAKSLLTGNDTYVVQIAPKYATDEKAKMVMLGAALAVESIFKKKKESKGGGGSSSDEEGGGDDE
jgi:uncharacterized protein YxjI